MTAGMNREMGPSNGIERGDTRDEESIATSRFHRLKKRSSTARTLETVLDWASS
jgi:hypothetical protein